MHLPSNTFLKQHEKVGGWKIKRLTHSGFPLSPDTVTFTSLHFTYTATITSCGARRGERKGRARASSGERR